MKKATHVAVFWKIINTKKEVTTLSCIHFSELHLIQNCSSEQQNLSIKRLLKSWLVISHCQKCSVNYLSAIWFSSVPFSSSIQRLKAALLWWSNHCSRLIPTPVPPNHSSVWWPGARIFSLVLWSSITKISPALERLEIGVLSYAMKGKLPNLSILENMEEQVYI